MTYIVVVHCHPICVARSKCPSHGPEPYLNKKQLCCIKGVANSASLTFHTGHISTAQRLMVSMEAARWWPAAVLRLTLLAWCFTTGNNALYLQRAISNISCKFHNKVANDQSNAKSLA